MAASRQISAGDLIPRSCDVLVAGATEAGCMAAWVAAELGAKVLLVSENERIGWMSGWGINLQDVNASKSVSVMTRPVRRFFAKMIRRETADRKINIWWRGNGQGRPSWYRRAWAEIAAHPNITVVYNASLTSITKPGDEITSLIFDAADPASSGAYSASAYVEGSPCGDLVQRALLSYSIGREAIALYSEALAGTRSLTQFDGPTTVDSYVIPSNAGSGRIFGVDAPATEPAGTGDGRTMQMCYRLFITSVPADKVAFPSTPSDRYNALDYEVLRRAFAANPSYFGDATSGLGRVFQFYNLTATGTAMGPTYMPYVDLNSGRFGTNYPSHALAKEYITATPTRRTEIRDIVKKFILDLFYWLLHSNDPAIPATVKTALSAYGFSNKELREYGGISPELYIREGARAIGDYVLKQSDMVHQNIADPIAKGHYGIDSHVVRFVDNGGAVYYEGGMLNELIPTQYGFPIPMRVLFPKRAECTNLILASQPSVSRVAWLSLRVAPSMMAIGAAAGVAAYLKAVEGVDVQDVNYARLRTLLDPFCTEDGIVLNTTGDFSQGTLTVTGTWLDASSRQGYLGASYKLAAAGAAAKLRFAPNLRETGAYRLLFQYPAINPSGDGETQTRASNLPVTIVHADGTSTRTVDQRYPIAGQGGWWDELGIFTFAAGIPSAHYVEIDAATADGQVTASAFKWVPVDYYDGEG